MKQNLMRRSLALLLAAVMVFGMVPAGVLAAQSGSANAPAENGSLIPAKPAEAHSLTGPMTLGSAPAAESVEVVQSGIMDSTLVQSVTEGELTKFESQGNTAFSKTEEYEQYAADEKVADMAAVVTAEMIGQDGLLLRKGKKGYCRLMLKA